MQARTMRATTTPPCRPAAAGRSGPAATSVAAMRALPTRGAPPPRPRLPPPSALPHPSARVLATDDPVIIATKRMIAEAGRADILSLAQGVVHWTPPPAALAAGAAALATDPASACGYGPALGSPPLVAALQAKVRAANGLTQHDVMVTAGANQGFVNLVLACLDAGDRAAVFGPYYFNAVMALQMTGSGHAIAVGPCDPITWEPDVEWLEAELSSPAPPRLVVIVSPSNPTGCVVPPATLARAAEACERAGAWLVLDSTYEDFLFGEEGGGAAGGGSGGARAAAAALPPQPRTPAASLHPALAAPHVLHLFSMSKAYGMMGWRVGYLAYHAASGLGRQLAKVQDTIPICPSSLSQVVAAAALDPGASGLDGGPAWVAAQVAGLAGNRAAVRAALAPLAAAGGSVGKGTGAIYHWAALPPRVPGSSPSDLRMDDAAVVRWLVRRHGVCTIPGSACGAPGHVRAAFGNLAPGACATAAARLGEGLEELVRKGMVGL